METIKYYSTEFSGNICEYNGPKLDNCHVIELLYYRPMSTEITSFVGRFFIPKGYKLETTFGRKATDCTADYSEILNKKFSRNLLTLKYDPEQSESIYIQIHGQFKYTNNFYKGGTHKFGNAEAGFITIKHL